MQNPWHKLNIFGVLTTALGVAVNTYDPSVVPPKVAGAVALGGLVVSAVASLFHTNKTTQAVIDAVSQIANKQAGGR